MTWIDPDVQRLSDYLDRNINPSDPAIAYISVGGLLIFITPDNQVFRWQLVPYERKILKNEAK